MKLEPFTTNCEANPLHHHLASILVEHCGVYLSLCVAQAHLPVSTQRFVCESKHSARADHRCEGEGQFCTLRHSK